MPELSRFLEDTAAATGGVELLPADSASQAAQQTARSDATQNRRRSPAIEGAITGGRYQRQRVHSDVIDELAVPLRRELEPGMASGSWDTVERIVCALWTSVRVAARAFGRARREQTGVDLVRAAAAAGQPRGAG